MYTNNVYMVVMYMTTVYMVDVYTYLTLRVRVSYNRKFILQNFFRKSFKQSCRIFAGLKISNTEKHFHEKIKSARIYLSIQEENNSFKQKLFLNNSHRSHTFRSSQ